MKKTRMHVGAALDEPTRFFFEQEELAESTYRKLVCSVDGKCYATDVPVELICGKRYGIWSCTNGQLSIGYDPKADQTKENAWWKDLREKVPYERCPLMYGDIVFYVRGAALQWNELILRREMINWLVVRYKYNHAYNFCDNKQT